MKYDVVIIGATSFVGQRFIKYYSSYFKENAIKVLATARNEFKVRPLIDEHNHIGCEILDVTDKEKVFAIVNKGKLVINFAGPFDLYGENLVAACAKHGVHYLDITGEAHFVRRMVQLFEEKAKSSGALIVPFAGFDSIPSDYAVYLTSLKAKQSNEKLVSLDLIYSMKGGFNGGTIATAMDMATKMSNQDAADRNYLIGSKPNLQKDYNKKRYIAELGKWVSPFFMEPVNSKVVYRSLALSDRKAFSENFAYRESIPVAGGKFGNSFFVLVSEFSNQLFKRKMGRKILSLFLPKPGEGPSNENIEKGFFKGNIIARTNKGNTIKGSVYSSGDPGNKSTIKLVGSAMKAILENKQGEKAGILTPSAAFGENLLPYLENEGIKFSIS